MAKLNEFVSEIKSSGLMRTARYSVIIPSFENDNTLVSMYCDTVNLPGLTYATNPVSTYGETREAPYQRMFDTLNMSFYVDNDMRVKTFFDNWLFMIQNPVDKTFYYYNDYVKQIQVNVEDLQSKTKYSVLLHECYPKTLNTVQMDYSSKDLMKINITFAYKKWEPVNTFAQVESYPPDDRGLLGEIQDVAIGLLNTRIGGLAANYGITKLQNKITSLSI